MHAVSRFNFHHILSKFAGSVWGAYLHWIHSSEVVCEEYGGSYINTSCPGMCKFMLLFPATNGASVKLDWTIDWTMEWTGINLIMIVLIQKLHKRKYCQSYEGSSLIKSI